MSKSKKDDGKVVFSADLEMTRIHSSGVTFKVMNPEGVGISALHHLILDRKFFPVDDNFNMGFMASDIKPQGNPRKHTPEYTESIKGLQKKQEAFRGFQKFKLLISHEE